MAVFVLGAGGNVGSSTVKSFYATYGDKLKIFGGARDPEKAAKAAGFDSLAASNVQFVKTDIRDKGQLIEAFQGVKSLFIVTPEHENRAELAINAAEAAKAAQVDHVIILSIPTSVLPNTILGRQFGAIERAVETLGISHTILRLPVFIDNTWYQKNRIQNEGVLRSPGSADIRFATVVVADVAKAAATILAHPSDHAGKIYTLVSDRHSHNELAAAFSSALGKDVKYVRSEYETARDAFLRVGFEKWQVDSMLELYELLDRGELDAYEVDTGDYETITGEKPTSMKTWVDQVAPAFK
ncbi:NAD(P)H azoreductase-like [Oscarella lobularis]|uniref:NAD(P)H azoreductase-like n=1 Tax=Oscarella lobularis TaxID=121494 RepID=UPI003313DDB0